LGQIFGIPIRIHYTLWILFLLIAWSLATAYMPANYPGLGVATYWTIGVACAILLFVAVLVHELSHSIIAKRNGLPISRITLFFFGGVSEISEEPRDPWLEVRMAAAGPLMSFLIAAVLGGRCILSIFYLLPRLVHQVRSREQPPTNSLDGGAIRSISWRHNDPRPSDGLTRDDNPTVDHRLLLEPTPRRIPSTVQRRPHRRGHNEFCPIHS